MKGLGTNSLPWGNEKALVRRMRAVQCLERSECEASPLGPNASWEHESCNNQPGERAGARGSPLSKAGSWEIPASLRLAGTPRDPGSPPCLEQSHSRRLRTSQSGAAIAQGDRGPPASRHSPLARQSRSMQRTRRMPATTASLNESRGAQAA